MQFPGVIVDSVCVQGVKPGPGEMEITTIFQVPEFGFVDQDILSVRIPWRSQLVSEYGVVTAEQRRETPLDLNALAMCESDEVTMLMPAPHRLMRLPENVKFQWEDCRYSTTYRETDGGMIAERKLNIEGDLVDLSKYPGFKSWFDKVRRDLEKTHHLRVD